MPLGRAKQSFREALDTFGVVDDERRARGDVPGQRPDDRAGAGRARGRAAAGRRHDHPARGPRVRVALDGEEFTLDHGAVVIAAITSCTNTSNPQVMIAAGLVAKKAVERGLRRRPWVKSSLAPGSRVVTDYYERAGLQTYLDELGFNTVGYGCTTCIGNSGPLPAEVSDAIADGDLVACAVLSGNRNFEARIHPEVKANYLASPPLVVAYALAGRMDVDLETEPLGQGSTARTSSCATCGRARPRSRRRSPRGARRHVHAARYADVFTGDEAWREPAGARRRPLRLGARLDLRAPAELPRGAAARAGALADIEGARCLVVLGDSVTTDHISPAGSIKADSPAGRYLVEHGVEPRDFNSYGARRGNHEVMVRGTFANVRMRNLMVPGSEGTVTVHVPSGEQTTIFDASRAVPRRGHAARSCSPARSTARARRATGPRRARCCSASAR